MSAPGRPEPQKIVILKTGEPVPTVRERRGEFHDLIALAIGPAWQGAYGVVDARTDEPLPAPGAPNGPAAFVITGSAASVPDRLPWMLRTEAWLREVVAAGTPTFGICFGHQILAQALGGEVQRNPRGREMGTMEIERVSADPLFAGLADRFQANVTHVDSVVRLPPGAEPLARSALESHQALRFAERCYGVQFHPEIDGDAMRGYLDARRPILTTEGFDVDAMIERAVDTPDGTRILRNFARSFVRLRRG